MTAAVGLRISAFRWVPFVADWVAGAPADVAKYAAAGLPPET
jgi:hypothetical protein